MSGAVLEPGAGTPTVADIKVVFDHLGAPFEAAELDWKIQTSPKDANGSAQMVPFISARSVMVRLDDALGFGLWESRMTSMEHGILCEITCRIGGLMIVRSDVGAWTVNEFRTKGENPIDHVAVKGAASDAFKRAAVHFRVGRYLYVVPKLWLPASQLVRQGDKFRLPWPGTPEHQALMNSLFEQLPTWARPAPTVAGDQPAATGTVTRPAEPQRDTASSADDPAAAELDRFAPEQPDVDQATGEITPEQPAAPAEPHVEPDTEQLAGRWWEAEPEDRQLAIKFWSDLLKGALHRNGFENIETKVKELRGHDGLFMEALAGAHRWGWAKWKMK